MGRQIREASNGSITKVLDTVATTSTAAICGAAFSSEQTKSATQHRKDKENRTYCSLLDVKCPRDDVDSVFFLGYSMSGESYILETDEFPAWPEDLEFARRWIRVAERLWAEGKWKPHPEKVEGGGLLGCVDGMEEMRRGRVSGVKLVYRVDETAWPL